MFTKKPVLSHLQLLFLSMILTPVFVAFLDETPTPRQVQFLMSQPPLVVKEDWGGIGSALQADGTDVIFQGIEWNKRRYLFPRDDEKLYIALWWSDFWFLVGNAIASMAFLLMGHLYKKARLHNACGLLLLLGTGAAMWSHLFQLKPWLLHPLFATSVILLILSGLVACVLLLRKMPGRSTRPILVQTDEDSPVR